MITEMPCVSCIHNQVCRYKDSFNKFIHEVKEIKVLEPFELTSKCKEYSLNETYRHKELSKARGN